MPLFSKPMTNAQVQALVLGSVAVVSVLGLVYYMTSSGGSKAAPTSDEADEEESGDEAEEEEAGAGQAEVQAAKKAPSAATAAAAAAAPVAKKQSVTVEEVADGDETDEEEGTAEAEAEARKEAALLKEQYDQLISVALKYAKGEKYRAAIDKYCEALALMPRLPEAYYPSVKKDLTSIHNNRSAMYEKSGDFDNALKDVAEVLKADKQHAKARGRRARIYEATGRHREALVEHGFLVAFLQQKAQALSMQAQYASPTSQQALQATFETLQADITSGAAKMEELAKLLASQRSVACLEELKNSTTPRALPCQSYCKNFLETFPSYYVWRCVHKQAGEGEEDVRKYQSAIEDAVRTAASPEDSGSYKAAEHVRLTYLLATHLLLQERYAKAFNLIAATLSTWEKHTGVSLADADAVVAATAACPYEFAVLVDLHGVATHLRCNIMQAMRHYELARQLSSVPVTPFSPDNSGNAHGNRSANAVAQAHYCEMQLKLASAYVEIGEHEKAEAAFTDIEQRIAAQGKSSTASAATHAPAGEVVEENSSTIPAINNEAWMLIHRAAFWVSRIRNAAAPSVENIQNVRRALADIKKSFAASKQQQREAREQSQAVNSITEACHLLCLIKSIQINIHYSQQMGIGADGEEGATPFADLMEQLEEAKAAARGVHDAVVQLEMELLFYSGDYDAAVAKCDALIAKEEAKQVTLAQQSKDGTGPTAGERPEDCDDCQNSIPFILKANFLSQKAFAMVQEGQNPAAIFADMEKLFMRALELEPQSVDAMVQYANIKTLFGAPAVSAKYTDLALPHARNLQELLDILQLNEMTKAQTKVLEEVTQA